MSSPTSPTFVSAHLDVTQGPLQGQSIDLVAPETIIGREFAGNVQMTSYREVSRQHARFYLQRGVWCVEDLGSTNGTFVNNVRATPSFSLADGVQIQMGDFHARFRLAAVNVQPNSTLPTQQSPTLPQAPLPAPATFTTPTSSGSPVPFPVEPPKQVMLAVLFSFLLIGGGQLYNGENTKAIPLLIGGIISFIFTMFCFIGFPVLCLLWVWGMIDAVQSAERINREAGFKSGGVGGR